LQQLVASGARARRQQHQHPAQHRAGQEGADASSPPVVMRRHEYDPSVTRHPAPFVNINREVREALERGRPVVALETTYVAHGFPHPEGVETAVAALAAVREAGAVPAAIGLVAGEIRIGLDEATIEQIALGDARKVAPRDLAACLADGSLGATTVAGTLACARLTGIHHAATGGIGGVHRDAQDTFDVSADIAELARCAVCLVCSGVKSLLDVPRTLELLETLGVPVVGYGASALPGFFSRSSPHELGARVDTPDQAAYLCALHWELGRGSAVLVAQPPPEDSALSSDETARLIDAAIAAAAAAGTRGGAVTPFVLDHVHRASGGATLRANRDLIIANSALAAQIAVCAAQRAAR
jgi:pseudouridylate synthase